MPFDGYERQLKKALELADELTAVLERLAEEEGLMEDIDADDEPEE